MCRSNRLDERGAAAIEFALTAVLFITLVFGIIQYSLYFWSTQSAANAAREAARRGAVGETCAALQARTDTSVKLAHSAITVSRRYYDAAVTNFETATAGTAATGKNVRVSVVYNSVDLNFPFVPFIGGGAVTEVAVARVENYNALVPTSWAAC